MKKNKYNVVFVISAGHSGSTLLTKILGQHSGIFGGGELHNYSKNTFEDKSLCSCGKYYYECGFWSEIFKRHQPDNINVFSRLRKRSFLLGMLQFLFTLVFGTKFSNRSVKKEVQDYVQLYKEILETSGKDLIVDSSKNFFNALIIGSQKEVNAKYIFLHRDGRAVINSYKKKHYSVVKDGEKITHSRKTSYALHEVIRYWVKQNRLGLLLMLFRRRSLRLAHESMLNQFDLELKRLYDFCGVEYETFPEDFSKEDHIYGGNSSRINTSKIVKTDVDRWRKGISSDELEAFYKKASLINRILGYKK